MGRAAAAILVLGLAAPVAAQTENPAVAPPVVQNPVPPPVVQNRVPPPVIANAAPPPVAPEAISPPAEDETLSSRRDWPGKLFLSGLGCYVVSYGLTVLAGLIISASDSDGKLLYWPVVGPGLYTDQVRHPDSELVRDAVLSTVFQSIGIIGMAFGLMEMASDDPQGS
jgi:hypothetical protein